MRSFVLWTALLLFPLLTGCGNRDDGHPFNPYPKSSSSVLQNPVQVGNQPPNQFQSCVSPTVYTADQGFTYAFQGSVLCPGLANNQNVRSNLVRLKVTTAVPANTQLCLVPFVGNSAVQENCVPVNGQADVWLSTNQYTSIVVVPQAYIQAYKDYLATPGAIPPSRLLFSL